MDDYDWLMPAYDDWSHWSHHEETIVTNITIFDAKVSESSRLKGLSYVLGYKYDTKTWKAYDGTYVYSSDPGYRDQTGSFNLDPNSNVIMITYIQEFHSVYLGLEYQKKFGDFTLAALANYAPSVVAFDYDIHHARNIKFDSVFSGGTAFETELSIRYNYQGFFLQTSYTHHLYNENRGDTYYTNLVTDYKIAYPGAGISSHSEYYSLSLGKVF